MRRVFVLECLAPAKGLFCVLVLVGAALSV
jgi:hypothetical protein